MNTVTIAYEPYAMPFASAYPHGEGMPSNLSIVESPEASGRFIVDFDGVDAGTYDLIMSDGGYNVYAETFVWDGSTLSDPFVSAGDVDLSEIEETLEEIKAKTDLISSGKIVVQSTFGQTGEVIEIVRGDDYANADGRALVFTIPDFNLAECDISFVVSPVLGGAEGFTATGTVVDEHTARVELSAEQTGAIDTGTENYSYQLIANRGGHVCTQILGYLSVRDALVPVPE